jgi:selenocysteine-specific elongation factor
VHARLRDSPSLDPGIALAEVLPSELAPDVLPLLGLERRGPKVYLPGAAASLGEKARAAEVLEAELAEAGAHGVKVDDDELTRYLEAEGRLVRLGGGQAVSADAYAAARETVLAECERDGRITLARFRDVLGISRRPAQLLLERLDVDGVTRRVGDERILRRAALR